MEISWLRPYRYEGNKYYGGLEDLGNFKEGFCFKIVARNDALWNICADTLNEKIEWM
jgi:hypothetical protein